MCFVYNGGEEEPHNGKRESPKPDQRMKKSPHILPNTSHPAQCLGDQPPHRVTQAATLQSAWWQLGGQEVGEAMAWLGCVIWDGEHTLLPTYSLADWVALL